MARPTAAILDLDALRHNVAHARSLAPGSKLMAVVKANAYGHGATVVAAALEDQADALAVASLEEALELRESGISTPILMLEGVFEPEELSQCAAQNLWITIASEQQLNWLEAARLEQPLACWLKVNTGMNRLGVESETVPVCFTRLGKSVNAQPDPVLYTHFAAADNLSSSFTQGQLARFNEIPIDTLRSAANSAGVLAWPDSHFDWVRPGYMLYGNSPLDQAHPNCDALRAVMTLRSQVIAIRDVNAGEPVGYSGTYVPRRPTRIATIAIGYGDGYPRNAPNGTPLLINGQRAQLAGRVSMDMITADITGLTAVHPGSEVILWGPDLPVEEVARHAGTLGYELTTRMPPRAPRIIRES